MVDIVGIIYGAIVATGGLIGYFKASSIPSLVMGVGSGAIVATGAYFNNTHVVCGVSALLTIFMGRRYLNSGKVFPAGVVAVLSLLILLRCISIYYKSRPRFE
uniref:Transmembrane protein 14C n=1 Tax=Parastrongyloides trichosuri TaxID=131310 RepID=A0A0N4ZVK5_PARTI